MSSQFSESEAGESAGFPHQVTFIEARLTGGEPDDQKVSHRSSTKRGNCALAVDSLSFLEIHQGRPGIRWKAQIFTMVINQAEKILIPLAAE